MTRKQALAGIFKRWPGLPTSSVKIEISAKLRGPRRLLVQRVELWIFPHDLPFLDSVWGSGDNIPEAFANIISNKADISEIEKAYLMMEVQDAAQ